MLNPQEKRPSLPVPGTSTKPSGISAIDDAEVIVLPKESIGKQCLRFLYNEDTKEYCGRSVTSWLYIMAYTVMYLIFLSTYTMIFLYGSLTIIKFIDNYKTIESIVTYSTYSIGLTATPTSVNAMPLVWYRNETQDYQKYVDNLENLLSKRRKREVVSFPNLGPCGEAPFGYGNNPCIIIRINKQLKWSAKPLKADNMDMNVPIKVQEWLKLEKDKLWLHCEGYHSYDKEHIGKINYYPDPPGFDSELFPLNISSQSPLIAIQISEFTLGMSLAIQCKVWYEGGFSTTEFVLYMTPKRK